MKTKTAFPAIAALFVLGSIINLANLQVLPGLLIGKWHGTSFLAAQSLEFKTDSTATLDEGKYRYFLKKDTIHLKDSVGHNYYLNISKLTKDTLQLVFLEKLRIDYTQVK